MFLQDYLETHLTIFHVQKTWDKEMQYCINAMKTVPGSKLTPGTPITLFVSGEGSSLPLSSRPYPWAQGDLWAMKQRACYPDKPAPEGPHSPSLIWSWSLCLLSAPQCQLLCSAHPWIFPSATSTQLCLWNVSVTTITVCAQHKSI